MNSAFRVGLFLCVAAAGAMPVRSATPAWNEAATAQLLAAVNSARDDGLEPRDYRLDDLVRGARDAGEDASALRHSMLLRLATDLHYGKLHAMTGLPGVELPAEELSDDQVRLLEGAIATATLP